MGHVKTIWRPPFKDKNGCLTASGYAKLYDNMLTRCIKNCTKEINTDCHKCKIQKVIDYILKKHIRRHAEGTPTSCICEFATCDIMSVGKCKYDISKEELQDWANSQGKTHKVQVL